VPVLADSRASSVTSASRTVTKARAPRILIVDDLPIVRHGLRRVLTTDSEWQVEISEAENGKMAVDKYIKLRPDVVVLDIVMPVMGGLEAAHEIRQLSPDANIIFISSHYPSGEASGVAQMFGGTFVSKSDVATELVPTIKRLLKF
jgi:DNA-binding NarL/FixJ family response regulator